MNNYYQMEECSHMLVPIDMGYHYAKKTTICNYTSAYTGKKKGGGGVAKLNCKRKQIKLSFFGFKS